MQCGCHHWLSEPRRAGHGPCLGLLELPRRFHHLFIPHDLTSPRVYWFAHRFLFFSILSHDAGALSGPLADDDQGQHCQLEEERRCVGFCIGCRASLTSPFPLSLLGDQVNVGDVLFEVETDKAVMVMESTEEGYLAKILVRFFEAASSLSVFLTSSAALQTSWATTQTMWP